MGGVSVLGFPVRSSNDFATSSSSGCGKAAPYDPATTSAAADFTMTFAGTTRHYLLKLPKSYDQNKPYPIILSFHGWGGFATANEDWTGLSAIADAKEFIVVYAQGYQDCAHGSKNCWTSWNAAGCSNETAASGEFTCAASTADQFACTDSCKPLGLCNANLGRKCNWCHCLDDVAFVRALYATLADTLCIETSNVCATGESNGGMFTYDLAKGMGDVFSAIIPFVAQPHVGFLATPAADTTVSLLAVYGTRDRVVPPAGGQSDTGWFFETVTSTMKAWASFNQCTGAAETFTPPLVPKGSVLSCTKPHGSCGKAGTDVVVCSFGGNHYTETVNFGALLTWKFCTDHKK